MVNEHEEVDYGERAHICGVVTIRMVGLMA